MKHTIRLLLIVALLVAPMGAERVNKQITITAGTPIRIATLATRENRLFIQSRHSNTGLIYIMLGVNPATTCNASSASQLSAELGPGDALHPGASFSDPQGANGNSPADYEDLSWACVDGTVNGDVVIISYWHRN